MYGIAGERRLDERELDWLPGFEGSRPVRVGNAASNQLQLDVYGEVLDAAYQIARAGHRAFAVRLGAAPQVCWPGSRTAGARRTPGSGRYAGRCGTSRTRR